LINNGAIFYVRNGLSGVTLGAWAGPAGIRRRAYKYTRPVAVRRRSGLGSGSGRQRETDEGTYARDTVKGPANYCLSPDAERGPRTRKNPPARPDGRTDGRTAVRLIFHESAWLSPEIVFRRYARFIRRRGRPAVVKYFFITPGTRGRSFRASFYALVLFSCRPVFRDQLFIVYFPTAAVFRVFTVSPTAPLPLFGRLRADPALGDGRRNVRASVCPTGVWRRGRSYEPAATGRSTRRFVAMPECRVFSCSYFYGRSFSKWTISSPCGRSGPSGGRQKARRKFWMYVLTRKQDTARLMITIAIVVCEMRDIW